MGLAAGVPVTVGLGWYPRTLSLPNSEVVDWVDAEVLGSRDAESCKSLVRDQVSESLSLSRTAVNALVCCVSVYGTVFVSPQVLERVRTWLFRVD